MRMGWPLFFAKPPVEHGVQAGGGRRAREPLRRSLVAERTWRRGSYHSPRTLPTRTPGRYRPRGTQPRFSAAFRGLARTMLGRVGSPASGRLTMLIDDEWF